MDTMPPCWRDSMSAVAVGRAHMTRALVFDILAIDASVLAHGPLGGGPQVHLCAGLLHQEADPLRRQPVSS